MRRLLLSLLCALSLFLPASAQGAPPPTPTSLIPDSGVIAAGCDLKVGLFGDPAVTGAPGMTHFNCIPIYIGYLIKLILSFAGGFFLFGIMIAGYKYMFGSVTAQGTEQGKKEIIARCIGLAVIVFSYLLVDYIYAVLT